MCVLTSWVKGVNVDAQVNRLFGANPVLDLLDDAIDTNLVNLSGFDNLETTVAIIFVVRGSRQRRADASMDIGVVGKKALLSSMEEVGTMVDACLLTRRPTKDLGLPSIQMTVEVDDTDRTVCTFAKVSSCSLIGG